MALVALGTEDELSEAVGVRLLAEHEQYLQPGLRLRKSGFGYLRSNVKRWRELAQRQPVVLITDLDQIACPPALLNDWLGGQARPENLLLRVAVREVEAWLLADHVAMQGLLGDRARLPPAPDALPDPKQHLLGLAKRAPRDVRLDLVQEAGSVSRQGLGYNARLTDLVRMSWSPARAAERSPSLARARRSLGALARQLQELN
ncbi:DUF4276 family protein [Rhodocyclus purpureus]|uniref:DUF4276 family protein n=1 Tax=Rhodocyclus purpureus TaxID=1067 RepID=UPI00191432FD|nr:DUF4276 family protein [Rhodocyclus purpureus]MBK5914137.1 hypothetical protein [Rhodocyclus purpureus]